MQTKTKGGAMMDEIFFGVNYLEGYEGTMPDFHSHPFYEITLVLAGNVSSLLADRALSGESLRLVLTPPGAPHFMRLAGPGLYRRINFHFSPAFLEDYVPEWRTLSRVFGTNGNMILLSPEASEACQSALLAIREEKDTFRARLLTLLLLSRISSLDGAHTLSETAPPRCVVEALAYVAAHYDEKIVAAALAWRLGVSRTTLMTAFHRHTGSTLSEHITRTRVTAAAELLSRGCSQEDAAARVGFGSASSLSRAFHRIHGRSPGAYLRERGERTVYFESD